MRAFSKVLVPLDLTERGKSAVRTALDLVDPDVGVLHLMHVVETIEGAEDAELEAFYAELETKAREKMSGWIEDVPTPAPRIETRVVYGHRAQEILREAGELGCDLVVLSSHRLGPEHPAGGLGTISHQVALVCDCPVLLIR